MQGCYPELVEGYKHSGNCTLVLLDPSTVFRMGVILPTQDACFRNCGRSNELWR